MSEEMERSSKSGAYNKKILEDSPTMRHLFNKLGKEVVVSCDGEKFRGPLKSIDMIRKFIEVEFHGQIYFFNLRRISFLQTPKSVMD